jgi:hypothetical protein
MARNAERQYEQSRELAVELIVCCDCTVAEGV